MANSFPFFFFFFKDFIYLFLERREGREEERERNINVWFPLARPLLRTWPTTQACALTGNLTSNSLVHRPMLNTLSHTSQGPVLFFKPKFIGPLLKEDFPNHFTILSNDTLSPTSQKFSQFILCINLIYLFNVTFLQQMVRHKMTETTSILYITIHQSLT